MRPAGLGIENDSRVKPTALIQRNGDLLSRVMALQDISFALCNADVYRLMAVRICS